MTMKPYILPPVGGVAGLAVGEGGVWTADFAVSHMDPDRRDAGGNLGRASSSRARWGRWW